jgi:hypothetical protein
MELSSKESSVIVAVRMDVGLTAVAIQTLVDLSKAHNAIHQTKIAVRKHVNLQVVGQFVDQAQECAIRKKSVMGQQQHVLRTSLHQMVSFFPGIYFPTPLGVLLLEPQRTTANQ